MGVEPTVAPGAGVPALHGGQELCPPLALGTWAHLFLSRHLGDGRWIRGLLPTLAATTLAGYGVQGLCPEWGLMLRALGDRVSTWLVSLVFWFQMFPAVPKTWRQGTSRPQEAVAAKGPKRSRGEQSVLWGARGPWTGLPLTLQTSLPKETHAKHPMKTPLVMQTPIVSHSQWAPWPLLRGHAHITPNQR